MDEITLRIECLRLAMNAALNAGHSDSDDAIVTSADKFYSFAMGKTVPAPKKKAAKRKR